MAKEKTVSTKFKVDIGEFKKGITEANKQIKLANAEFKNASASMADWSKSSDGLEAKIKQLNTVLGAEETKLSNLKKQQDAVKLAEQEASKEKENLKKKIDDLKKEYDNLVKSQGDNTESTLELKNKIIDLNKEYKTVTKTQEANAKQVEDLDLKILNQETSIKKTKLQIENYDKALNDLNDSNSKVDSSLETLEKTIEEQEKALKDLVKQYQNVVLEQGENSSEAKDLESSISQLNSELKDSKKKLNDVEGASDKLTDSLKDVDKETDNAGDGFTILKGALADVTGNIISSAIGQIGDLVSSLFDLSEATKEYRTMNAKLEGSAKSFGTSTEYASDKYKELYGYLGDDQMATNAVTNLLGLKASQEDLNKIIDGAIGVWSAYGDSIPIEGLTESINETAQVGKVTGSLADALNWAGISEDEFNKKLEKTKTTQERANLIADVLNDTYGDSKKTYDEMTGSIQEANKAEVELKDIQAELGGTIEPLTTSFNNLKSKALELLLPIVQSVVNVFMDLKKYLEEHPVVMGILIGVVTSLATAFTVLAGALAIQGLIAGVTKALAFLNTTILANPTVLIVTGIIAVLAGLVVAFKYAWDNVEGFREFFTNAWEIIKTKVMDVWDNYLKPTFEAIGNVLSKIWNEYVKPTLEKLWTMFQDIFGKLKELWETTLKPVFEAIGSVLKWVWDFVVAVILVALATQFTIAFKTVETLWNKVLKPVFSALGSFFKSTWDNVLKPTLGYLKEAFKTAFDGVKWAWDNVLKPVFNAMKSVFSGVWDGMKPILNAIIGGIESMANGAVWGMNKVIDTLNGLSFDIPKWVPKFGGKKFGFNIGKLNEVSIPRLANGGLAKANNPFMAIVGDNPTQDEIISPVGTIRSIVNEELQDIKNAIKSMSGGAVGSISNSSTTNNTFNQYITSPKELSTLDIYRQSRNLLKGGVKV